MQGKMSKYWDVFLTVLGIFWILAWSLRLGIFLFSSEPVLSPCGYEGCAAAKAIEGIVLERSGREESLMQKN